MVGSAAMTEGPSPEGSSPMSDSEVAAKIRIEQVLNNAQACAAYHRFLMAIHAEENILFWGAAEVYHRGEWKGMKVIGFPSEETMGGDDEGSALLQKQMVMSRASVRIGFTANKRLSLATEARLIYEKFIKEGASLEV
eukprot:CAMPEP_0184532350 /NCGR_PEP_ID=MMETSP0198_2-20121128/14111_1 /TAXON_ID=1112570 /ORGANISM="Thraustochytrium sp., Strain LLF1b" /LENGTH=137 /DNA_ID=CAMNT_0026924923 /DNA_START=213 /DNA_END=622 /DNA_ORIENTATION=+